MRAGRRGFLGILLSLPAVGWMFPRLAAKAEAPRLQLSLPLPGYFQAVGTAVYWVSEKGVQRLPTGNRWALESYPRPLAPRPADWKGPLGSPRERYL